MRGFIAVAALAAGTALAADEPFVVKIVARDGLYTPPNLEVPAGVRIKVMISNEGKEPMEFESLPLKIEKVLAPGASSSVVINKLKPGQYPFWDEFHPDTSKGFIIAK
ncbi:MAG: cupredoxin domain-containing protein [Proteobacteria bacterium]|nr:cupredoxin domain-containing protein [Pseudomonadota bacterium]